MEHGGLESLAENVDFWLAFAFSSGERYAFEGMRGRRGIVGVYGKNEVRIYVP